MERFGADRPAPRGEPRAVIALFLNAAGVNATELVSASSRNSKIRLHADTVEERKRDLGRAMDNLYHFLNLVGFIALLLGGVGVASAIYVHVKQKLNTVAVLAARRIGGASVFVYLAQAWRSARSERWQEQRWVSEFKC